MSTWGRLPWVPIGMPFPSVEEIVLKAGNVVPCIKRRTLFCEWHISHFHLAASMTQEEGTCHIVFQPFLSLLLSKRWVTSGRGCHQFILDHLCPKPQCFPQMKCHLFCEINKGGEPNFSASGNVRLSKTLGLIFFFISVLVASCFGPFFTVNNLQWMPRATWQEC